MLRLSSLMLAQDRSLAPSRLHQQNPSALLSSLVATLSPRESRDDDAVIRAISTDLASLRWLSHALAENKEVEKAKVAEMKQTVDEARLKLENARLEERELREEIRREEAE